MQPATNMLNSCCANPPPGGNMGNPIEATAPYTQAALQTQGPYVMATNPKHKLHLSKSWQSSHFQHAQFLDSQRSSAKDSSYPLVACIDHHLPVRAWDCALDHTFNVMQRPSVLMRLWARPGVWISLSFRFSRATRGAPDTPADKALFLSIHPISRQSDFRVPTNLKEKTTLPGAPDCVTKFNHVTIQYPRPGWRILTPLPVKTKGQSLDARITF